MDEVPTLTLYCSLFFEPVSLEATHAHYIGLEHLTEKATF